VTCRYRRCQSRLVRRDVPDPAGGSDGGVGQWLAGRSPGQAGCGLWWPGDHTIWEIPHIREAKDPSEAPIFKAVLSKKAVFSREINDWI